MRLTLLLPLFLIAYFQTSEPHHVVFEEIGTMAGAISYIHAIVPVNITGLLKVVYQAQRDMDVIAAGFQKLNKIKQNEHLKMDMNAWLDIMKLDFQGLIETIHDLRATLPQKETILTPSKEYRIKRNPAVAFSILRGVFGTLMGWFNHRRLTNLRDQLQEVQGQQNRLLQVQAATLHHVDELQKLMKDFVYELHHQQHIVTRYWTLDQVREQIRFNIQKLIRALQAAHQRRLSFDLLNSKRLQELFAAASIKAEVHHHLLLIHHPSDLLQIETSYVHDGEDVNLILHIPMAPADSILRLFQLRPFPLPFTDSHFILPDPTNQILAISSSGSERLSLEMSAVNLLGCHRVGSTYLCERYGVLNRELNSTCLGSLYVQDFTGATCLCNMKIVPQTETVLQLQDNWYLVYSPRSFTSFINCLNTTSSEVFVRFGINQLYVSPSCRLRLQQHELISDFTVRLDSVIKHYQWDLERVAFSIEERAQSAEWLSTFGTEHIGKSTLSSIRQSLAAERRSPKWIYIFTFLGLIAALALVTSIIFFVLTKHLVTWKQRVIAIIHRVLPEPILRLLPPSVAALLQPPPAVAAPALGAPPQ